ncbi:NADH-quinone oxidoreductase subunit NuoF [Alkalibacter rhizosphaerae]|nr:NADH-quinone oxidoreductase subunit NuoF [Alkalibacter rhizosphaerae]
MATCGIAAGAKNTFNALEKALKKKGMSDVKVSPVGCIGSCYCEPTIQVNIPGQAPAYYGYVDEAAAGIIVDSHFGEGEVPERNMLEIGFERADQEGSGKKRQKRIALRNCGSVDPQNIMDYIAYRGYEALGKVLEQKDPDSVLEIIKKSGLRGRGGGGYPTGYKWHATALQPAKEKYIICNADEGDPGAFMDRSILEGDPHSVLEAMAIGGYATGANQGIIYIRAEYPLAIERLKIAIAQAKELGLLGENIFGSGFDFSIELRLGAGAFVCGEETALIHSVEGERGEPTKKPPYPSVSGYKEKPTTVNNVETLANVPSIILNGADWFAGIGTEKSKGTKVFALVGKVNRVGLVEVPMGTTLREIIYDIGGGINNDKEFRAVQTGGPSGGVITVEHLDTPIDYDSLKEIGSMMGSGGMIVMDETDCMVNIAKFYLGFTQEESCGKCTPCRIGTKRMYEILDQITKGEGQFEDLEKLERLGNNIKLSALCGLGQTAPNPVLSTMKYFREEYERHVTDHKCDTGSCKGMRTYRIFEDKCIGCRACVKVCPVHCIKMVQKPAHRIDQTMCTKCGACFAVCKYEAIVVE